MIILDMKFEGNLEQDIPFKNNIEDYTFIMDNGITEHTMSFEEGENV